MNVENHATGAKPQYIPMQNHLQPLKFPQEITWHKSIFMKNYDFYKNFFLNLSRIFLETFKIGSILCHSYTCLFGPPKREILLNITINVKQASYESVLQYFRLRDFRSRQSVHKLCGRRWHHIWARLIDSLHARSRRRNF